MTIEKKLQVLAAIGQKFNEAKVRWALGGSAMLYLKGIADDFNDLDIMIDARSRTTVEKILSAMGSARPADHSGHYQTKCFLEYEVREVEVDIIGGFVIVHNGKAHDCHLRKQDITDGTAVNGCHIPLQAVSCWHRYYQLMDRPAKVALIETAQPQKRR